jgi:hypothetical protein
MLFIYFEFILFRHLKPSFFLFSSSGFKAQASIGRMSGMIRKGKKVPKKEVAGIITIAKRKLISLK